MLIAGNLSNRIFLVEHIGSTSVPGLASKPTIDIALIIQDLSQSDGYIKDLSEIGYIHTPELIPKLPNRRFLWKGTKNKHEYHIHIIEMNSTDHHDLIYFREFLRSSKLKCNEYARVKRFLAKKHGSDIGNYVLGKNETYLEILTQARKTLQLHINYNLLKVNKN